MAAGQGITAEDREVLRIKFETTIDEEAQPGYDPYYEDDDEDELYDEFGYPLPPRFDAAPKTDGIKKDKNGKVIGITAQLAEVRNERPTYGYRQKSLTLPVP